jgi:hypothetical protein
MSEDSGIDPVATVDDSALANDVWCERCGYNLRGLGRDGDCPECGGSILQSLRSRVGMTKRELTSLVVRLFVLWRLLAYQYDARGVMIRFVRHGIDFRLLTAVATAVLYASLLGLLWWKAGWISRRLFERDGPLIAGTSPGAREIAAVAVASLGILYAMSGMTMAALRIIEFVIVPSSYTSILSYALIRAVAKIVVGSVLFLCSGWIGRIVVVLPGAKVEG